MRGSVLLMLVLVSGCESVADVVDKQRANVEKTFAAVRALAPRVESAAPLSQPALEPLPVPLVLEGKGANAMFIYAEDVPRPGDARPVALRTLDSLPLLQCGALLANQRFMPGSQDRPSPSVVEGYLLACAHLRYVLVIRQREFTRPVLQLETRKFAPGRYRADVYVFDLSNGAALGGFPVEARNEASVDLIDEDTDHLRRLVTNLEAAVFSALRDAVRAAIPGALPR